MKKEYYPEARLLLESNSTRYHIVGAWVGACLNPFFAITDYFMLPEKWDLLFIIRLVVSGIIVGAVLLRSRLKITSSVLISIPFVLLALQNAITYLLIKPENLLGQNLNFIALLIGGGMFILWRWHYSLLLLFISWTATLITTSLNQNLDQVDFFVQGGLLLLASGIFMMILIHTRYRLTMSAITAELELKESKALLEQQAEEIQSMNDDLERKIRERTSELQKKNLALEEYAFINSHKLRAPVATILGLTNLLSYLELKKEDQEIVGRIHTATENLDKIVKEITTTIERADEKGSA